MGGVCHLILSIQTTRISGAIINDAGSTSFSMGAEANDSYQILVTLPNGAQEQYYYDGVSGESWYVAPNDYVEGDTTTDVPKVRYTFCATSRGEREAIQSILWPDGRKKSFTVDYNTGLITSVSDAHSNTTRFTYTALGKVSSKTLANGEVINYLYDETGIDLLEVQSSLGSTRYAYSAQHQVPKAR